jgi:hypothetical protein
VSTFETEILDNSGLRDIGELKKRNTICRRRKSRLLLHAQADFKGNVFIQMNGNNAQPSFTAWMVYLGTYSKCDMF